MSSRHAIAALVVALWAPAGSVLAQTSSSAADVLAAERRWSESLVKADVESLTSLYADDLVYVHNGGNVETKAQFLDRIKKGGLKYQKVELVDPKVRLYGDTAVVNGTFNVAVQVDGQPVNNSVVYMHVYARQGGAWRLVAHQTTRVPAKP